MPRNLDTPYPIVGGQNSIANYADGFQAPDVNFTLIPLYNSAAGTGLKLGWFKTAVLVALMQTFSGDDLAAVGSGGIDFADAQDASGSYNIMNPKCAGYTLIGQSGESIQLMMRYKGTNTQASIAAAPTVGIAGSPLQFDQISFTGALATLPITGFRLDVDYGMTPNPILNQTLHPTEQNAGIQTARLHISQNGGAALADGALGSIVIANTIVPVTFALGVGVCSNPVDRRQATGRVIRNFEYTVFGTTTPSNPVVIS